ncbi:MAG: cobalamin-binding protein, partial [candidate division WOR-3 bacterium]|nr:cobalamin-binding protein [candidate division WOR-3 bacterium]MDW7988215.1 cobalamin-binding protein [candidate division WOR-3 bacterium]
SATEIIYALGKESLLVGNTIYCDFPEEAKKIYKVGDFSNPSLERILLRKPTLVIATLPEQKLIIEELKKHNIPVYISHPKTIDSIYSEIRKIGNLIGASTKAESLVCALKTKLATIIAKNPNLIDSPKVYVEINGNPIMTAGNLSYLNEIISYAGGKNIFSDINREYFVANPEEIITRNPDIIIALYPQISPSAIRKRFGWDKITAVKKNHIYTELNPDHFFRPGPRFINAIEELTNIIYNIWTPKSRP